MLKTLVPEELASLKRMLPHYFRYTTQQTDTVSRQPWLKRGACTL